MTRLRHVVLLLLMLALVGSVAQAQEGDSDAEERIGLDFVELFSGEDLAGAFDNALTAQMYRFTASAGDRVTLTMVQAADSTLDPYLVLLGPFGEVLSADDDSFTQVPLAATIDDYTIETDGVYYVLATDANFLRRQPEHDADSSDLDLDYTLRLNGANLPRDFEEDDSAFFTETILPGDSFEVQISVEFPVFYAFLPADDDLTATITALSEDVDTLLMVFNQDGERVAVNDDIGSGNYSSLLEDLDLPGDSAYLVMVTAFDFVAAHLSGWTNAGIIELSID